MPRSVPADARERFGGPGMEIVGGTPEPFAACARAEFGAQAAVVRKGNIRHD